MKRQSNLKRQNSTGGVAGGAGSDDMDAADRRAGGQEEHVLLDVWSIKQGAMRLQTLPFAVIMIAFMGLYFCVSSILNYNAIDADQRDMVTNMRIMLPGRMTAHNISRIKCKPDAVGVYTDTSSVTSPLETIRKSRERLSDPRLLGYTEVVHPMVMMRQRSKGDYMDVIEWDYYTSKLSTVTFPPFQWDADIFVNVSFKVETNDILQATQLINSWAPEARPKLSYNFRANDNTIEVWSVMASLGTSLRAFKISQPNSFGVVTVSHVKSILIETRYDALDVPATQIQTNAAAADWNGGQPVIKQLRVPNVSDSGESSTILVFCDKYFDRYKECRQTIYVPRLHEVSVLEYTELYKGPWSADAKARLDTPLTVDLQVEVRDMSQPRPYTPLFTGFGPFFIGFGFLCAAVLLLFLWMGLRFYVVNKHVRENEGKPPMFYQGMLRFRGW